MRMKHAGAPERFMDSEVDLDEVLPEDIAVRRSASLIGSEQATAQLASFHLLSGPAGQS